MKKTSPHPILRLLTIAMGTMLMLPSCDKDNTEISPSVIQFTLNLQNVPEGDEAAIMVALDKPASVNSWVEVTIETNAVYKQHYTSNPLLNKSSIALFIKKGAKSATLKITTLDNAKYENARFFIFQMTNPTYGLRLGKITGLTLIVSDDEGPSLANFAVSSATLSEQDEDGIAVDIPFSAPAKGEGSLTVTMQPGQAVIGTNFTIDQELTNNSFSFNVVKNSAGVSFKVFPVDNDLFTSNFILQFAITDVSGVIQKGDNLTYSLTLVDDEAPSVVRFAQLSGTMDESDADGIIIEIPLSSPVKGEGMIGITLAPENSIYGTDFTTVPEPQNNSIMLNLSHDQTSASFTVLPVDDDILTEDRVISFSIDETGGVVWKGSHSLMYRLTIVDDD